MTGAVRGVRVALLRAVPLLFAPRILASVLLPIVGSLVAWSVIGVLAWDAVTTRIASTMPSATGGGIDVATRMAVGGVSALAALLLFGLGALVTMVAAIALFSMPAIVASVSRRYFPSLERRRGGTVAGSAVNALAGIGIFVPLWLLTLPLLAFPPAYVAASLVLGAWFNQRMFRYDALAEHADRSELAQVTRASRRRFMLLGLAVAPLALVPLVNLAVPIYAGVAFACLALDELAALRARAT